MTAATWTTIRLRKGILPALGLPDLPFPVREERLPELFARGRVRFDLVLEEVDAFLTAHPEARRAYRPLVVGLSHALALHEGMQGRPADAVRLLRLAHEHEPQSARIQADLALGLHLSGRLDEAVERYRETIGSQGERAYPLLRVLAAKACEEGGRLDEARNLLGSGDGALATDRHVARRLERYRALTPAEPLLEPKPPRFCRACGAGLRPGKRYCPRCGGATGVAP